MLGAMQQGRLARQGGSSSSMFSYGSVDTMAQLEDLVRAVGTGDYDVGDRVPGLPGNAVPGGFSAVALGALALEHGETLDPTTLCPPDIADVPGVVCSPVLVSGLVVIANKESFVTNNNIGLILSADIVHLILTGNITMWDDPRILAVNPLATFAPAVPIRYAVHDDPVLSTVLDSMHGVLVSDTELEHHGDEEELITPDFVLTSAASAVTKALSTPGAFTIITSDAYNRGLSSVATVSMISDSGEIAQFSPFGLLAALEGLSADTGWTVIDTQVRGAWPLAYLEWIISFTEAPTGTPSFCRALEDVLVGAQSMLELDSVAVRASELGHLTLPRGQALQYQLQLENSTCAGAPIARPPNVLTMAGATTPVHVFEDLFEEYRQLTGVQVRYAAIGSGSGRKRLMSNTVVASASESVIPSDTLSERPSLEIFPVAASGVSIVYHMPLGSGAPSTLPPLTLTRELLADIFLAKVTTWSDPAIVSLNPELAPYITNDTICLHIRSMSSGLTEVFTSGLSSFSSEWDTSFGTTSLVPIWPSEGTAGGCVVRSASNSDLALAVATAASAIGYASIETAAALDVTQVMLINRDGVGVLPTPTTLSSTLNGTFSMTSPLAEQPFVRFLVDLPGRNAWPLVFYSYFIVDPVQPGGAGCSDLVVWAELFHWMLTSEAGLTFPGIRQFAPPDPATRAAIVTRMSTWTCGGDRVLDLCKLEGGARCPPVSSPSSDSTALLVLAIVLPIVLIGLLVIGGLVWWRVSRDVVFKVTADDDLVIETDDLVLGKQIGTGSYGTVYAGTWRGTPVAVKRFHGLEGPTLKSFVDEATVVLQLRHPNILLFMGLTLEPTGLVTEFVPNGSLYALLHNYAYTIPSSAVMWWAHSLAVAMDFLHSAGVIHRDFKSLNVLLDAGWAPRVCDFGLSSVKDNVRADKASRKKALKRAKARRTAKVTPTGSVGSGSTGSIGMRGSSLGSMNKSIGSWTSVSSGEDGMGELGSFFWLAPEVLTEGPHAVSEASDMYAYAVTLWEMMTRAEPYSGQSPVSVALEVGLGMARPNLELLPEWAQGRASILTRGWEQVPDARPTFRELGTELSRLYRPGFVELPFKPQVPSGHVVLLRLTILNPMTDLVDDGALELLASFLEKTSSASTEAGAVVADRSLNDMMVVCRVWSQVIELLTVLRDTASDEVLRAMRILIADGEMEMRKADNVPEALRSRVEFIGPAVNELVQWSDASAGVYLLPSAVTLFKGLVQTDQFAEHWSSSFLYNRWTASMADAALSCTADDVDGEPNNKVGVLVLSATSDALTSGHAQLAWAQQHMQELEDGESNPTSSGSDARPLALWRTMGRVPLAGKDNRETPPTRFVLPTTMDDVLSVATRMGVGSCATLYRGEMDGSGVFVKVLMEQSLGPLALARFVSGIAKAGAVISQTYGTSARILGICADPPYVGYVVELFEAGSLGDLIQKGNNTNGTANKGIVKGIAAGLTALHEQGFAHGGLKPTNVMFRDNAGSPTQVVLTDAGQAQLKSSLSTMTMSPSVAYCSIEELRGETVGLPADIFALGSVIYELITGVKAFAGINALQIGSRITQMDTPDLSELSNSAARLIESCWTESARTRPDIGLIARQIESMEPSDFVMSES